MKKRKTNIDILVTKPLSKNSLSLKSTQNKISKMLLEKFLRNSFYSYLVFGSTVYPALLLCISAHSVNRSVEDINTVYKPVTKFMLLFQIRHYKMKLKDCPNEFRCCGAVVYIQC